MSVASFVRSPWAAPLLVLGLAVLVRLPHFDVAWFGLDQIHFVHEARRIIAGDWNIVGPRASGFDVMGPMYSFLVAAVLWLRNIPSDLALFAALTEVAASWFVFDAGRRLSGPPGGLVAAFSYVAAPILVVGTRLIWNPSVLPVAVAIAWWLIVRHVLLPSTVTLAGVALITGMAANLHATTLFQAVGLAGAAVSRRLPSVRQLALVALVGGIPLLPIISRALGGSDAGRLWQRMSGPPEGASILIGFADITLGFPRLFEDWSGALASIGLYGHFLLATVGLSLGLAKPGPYRPVWIGIGLLFIAHATGALLYSGPIAWHHFIALVPPLCLCVGNAVVGAGRVRVAFTALAAFAIGTHLVFAYRFDSLAIKSGVIQVDTQWVGMRAPVGRGYSLHLRELELRGAALRPAFPDGATASLAARGARSELWRETGVAFLPAAAAPRENWPLAFVLMGHGARTAMTGPRLLDERVCAFDGRDAPTWWVRHGGPPAGWDLPGASVDSTWTAIRLPRRVAGASSDLPTRLASWSSPTLVLRGELTAAEPRHRRLFSVVVRGRHGVSPEIGYASVNGVPILANKHRVFDALLSRTQEWLFDVSSFLREDPNVFALAVNGGGGLFDLDVFELPCLDADWYH